MSLVSEATQGRTIIARFKPGKDIVEAINELLIEKNVQAGYIPTLIGGFKSLRLATRELSDDANHPKVTETELAEPLEYFGMGTVATVNDKPSIHVHLSGGKGGGASVTGHLLGGEIVLLTEIVIVECVDVEMTRTKDEEVYGYPMLNFA